MANPRPGYFARTGDETIDATTNGFHWQLDASRTIDWAIAAGATTWTNPALLAQHLDLLLGTISHFANVRFNYVGSFADPLIAYAAGSEITFSNAVPVVGGIIPGPSVLGRAFFPDPRPPMYYYGEVGDVFINAYASVPSFAPGSQGWFLFLHELGHAVGLKHPHDDGGTGRPTLSQLGAEFLNRDWVTVMSYNDDFGWNDLQWDPFTPMILDVLALQYLYGQNMATEAGDSIHSLERIPAYATIWDATGNDLVSVAGQPEGWYIFLPDEPLSSLVATPVGLAVPLQEFSHPAPTTFFWLAGDMEHAAGSGYADVLHGSSGANRLQGNGGDDSLFGLGGNDLLVGGSGVDTAHYGGNVAQFRIARMSAGVSVTDKYGVEGTDQLQEIERIEFADKSMDLGVAARAKTVAPATVQALVELYIAFFDRIPDSEGIAYWLGQAAAGAGISSIADAFYSAAVQYSSLTGYSSAMSNGDFVNVIYRNVLGRTSADSEGLAYWSGALASGRETRGTLVKTILDSAHTFKGHAQYGYVADLLDNKYQVGRMFAIDLGLSFNTPEESIARGMQIADAVTPTDMSAAIALIGVTPGDVLLG